MIDPHVHLRDWRQKKKERVKKGLYTAYNAGLDAVFEMPNTDPPLTSEKRIKKRIKLADKAIGKLGINIFHGLYAGLTSDSKQIEEVVRTYDELSQRVVGLKMFAGHSTGNMGIIKKKEQLEVYKTLVKLGYKGVLAVHCEKESYIKAHIWDHEIPVSHALARPPEAEYESVKDQIELAAKVGFKGTLHICHISVKKALERVQRSRENMDFRITCGITPHHAVLYNKLMVGERGLLLKMNPPLRLQQNQEYMLQALLDGEIDWIETDHAPHTLDEKLGRIMDRDGNPLYASGIRGFPYYPHFIKLLKTKGMSQEQIDAVTHDNIVKTFGIDIPNSHREPDYDLAKEYEFSAFDNI